MKGRNPSAEEKRWHDTLARHIGCQPCLQETGSRNDYVSIHHMDGRTKPDAHWLVLPLCGAHHQPIDPRVLAFHGQRRAFERRYGTELDLLTKAVHELQAMGEQVPARVLELTGQAVAA